MYPKFIQIHTLITYPTSLLNRSDNGRAKTMYYGNALRTRRSSQNIKFHFRKNKGLHSIPSMAETLELEDSVRSRWSFVDKVLKPVMKEIPKEKAPVARLLAHAISDLVTGAKPKNKKNGADALESEGEEVNPSEPESSGANVGTDSSGADEDLKLEQIVALGNPEIRFLRERLRLLCDELKDEAEAKKFLSKKRNLPDRLADVKKMVGVKAVGLDVALNGRMMTGDVLTQVDGCIKQSHALTVHEHTCEIDYFSAVDDIQLSGVREEKGHAHGGYADLTTGTFYQYTAIDVEGLRHNLGSLPPDVFTSMLKVILDKYVWMAATVGPEAKAGSTAPYSWADHVLIETGDETPRQLMRAWYNAVPRTGDVLQGTYDQLAKFLEKESSMYGEPWNRTYATTGFEHELLGTKTNMEKLAAQVLKKEDA